MKIEQIISLFGKEYKDSKLNSFFNQNSLNITDEVHKYMKTSTYKGMESRVYAENEENGYFLHFSDKLDFFDIEDGIYGESGEYYLDTICFYAQNVKGYNQYQGELINDVKMTDSKEEVRRKMGENYKRHDFLDEDIWEYTENIRVFANYGNKAVQEFSIYLHTPQLD